MILTRENKGNIYIVRIQAIQYSSLVKVTRIRNKNKGEKSRVRKYGGWKREIMTTISYDQDLLIYRSEYFTK